MAEQEGSVGANVDQAGRSEEKNHGQLLTVGADRHDGMHSNALDGVVCVCFVAHYYR